MSHQAEIIKAYFGYGDDWGLKIEYIFEKKPLGTMGPLSLIKDLPETFLVMNGDILTDLNYTNFLNKHSETRHLFSISATKREEPVDYGVLQAKDGRLTKMDEKPLNRYLVSMGVYAVNSAILDFIPKDKYFGFDILMALLLKKKVEVGVIPHDGYWLDIGRPEDYMKAIDMVEQNFEFHFDNG